MGQMARFDLGYMAFSMDASCTDISPPDVRSWSIMRGDGGFGDCRSVAGIGSPVKWWMGEVCSIS